MKTPPKFITYQLIDGKLITTPRRLYRGDKYKGWKTRTKVPHIMLDTTTTPVTFLSHYCGGMVLKAMPPEQLTTLDFMFYDGELYHITDNRTYRKAVGFNT